MKRYGPVLFIFLLLTTLIAAAWAIDEESRRQALRSKPPDPRVELAATQQKLGQALTLLEDCFGGPFDLEEIKTTTVTITAYSSTVDQCDKTPHITASNKPVRVGILAVSVDLLEELGLSFGQRVLIPGYGLFEIQDTMHTRWRRRVDIWESDREAARRFGKQEGTLIWAGAKKESV